VGRYLVAELLMQGRPVRIFCRPESSRKTLLDFIVCRGLNDSMIEWCEGDLFDSQFLEDSIKGCSRVYHAAAVVSFHPKDAEMMMRVNRDATEVLVNAMLHVGVRELVHVSSVAALGRAQGQPVHEEIPFESGPDVTAYAQSKFESELQVWRGQEEGLNVLTVNPTIIIGEGDFNRSSSELFLMVYKGLQWYPRGSNGFVSAKDVAKASVLLGDCGCWGQRFLLNSENRSYQSVFDQMSQEFGIPKPSRPLRSWMMVAAWRLSAALEFMTGKRAKATRESVANTQRHHTYKTNKLENTLSGRDIVWVYEPINDAIGAVSKALMKQLKPN
jgi:nucleoside-diphosphate-sugar epimerase